MKSSIVPCRPSLSHTQCLSDTTRRKRSEEVVGALQLVAPSGLVGSDKRGTTVDPVIEKWFF